MRKAAEIKQESALFVTLNAYRTPKKRRLLYWNGFPTSKVMFVLLILERSLRLIADQVQLQFSSWVTREHLNKRAHLYGRDYPSGL